MCPWSVKDKYSVLSSHLSDRIVELQSIPILNQCSLLSTVCLKALYMYRGFERSNQQETIGDKVSSLFRPRFTR